MGRRTMEQETAGEHRSGRAHAAGAPAAAANGKSANGVASASKPSSARPANGKAANGQPANGKGLSGSHGEGSGKPILVLPPGYRPSESEPFMCERQKLYFRNKLLLWRDEILEEGRETLSALNADTAQHSDIADRASSETDKAIELRARDRQRKLIAKIEEAMVRIEDGSYGYCAETGEPIGLRRLDARPIATLSVEAQERHERRERVHRDERQE